VAPPQENGAEASAGARDFRACAKIRNPYSSASEYGPNTGGLTFRLGSQWVVEIRIMNAHKGNIVLIGMPGAGKSTLGVVLAKIMNKSFLDGDLAIQSRHGKTLQAIIDEAGTDAFIEIENEVLRDIAVDDTVIATGGSAVYSDEAMKHLASIGTVVYLEITYDSLVERLGDLQERGVVLKGGITMSLHDLYEERRPLYERYAEVTVDVDKLSITDAARKVARAVSDGAR